MDECLTHLTSNILIKLADAAVDDELLLAVMKLLQDSVLMPSQNNFGYKLGSVQRLETLSGNTLKIALGSRQEIYMNSGEVSLSERLRIGIPMGSDRFSSRRKAI